MTIHETRIEYALNNNLTANEAAKHFNIDVTTFSKSLIRVKDLNINLYNAYKLMFKKNKNKTDLFKHLSYDSDEQNHIQLINKKMNKYSFICSEILSKGLSRQDILNNYSEYTTDKLNRMLIFLKKYNNPLYKIILLKINNGTMYNKIASYVLSSPEICLNKQISKKFGFKEDNEVTCYLSPLRHNNKPLYNKVMSVLHERHKVYSLFNKIYIIKYKKALKHKKISNDNILNKLNITQEEFENALYYGSIVDKDKYSKIIGDL